MKRILLVLLCAAVCVSCTACSWFKKQASATFGGIDQLSIAEVSKVESEGASQTGRSIDDYIDKIYQQLDDSGESLSDEYCTGRILSEGDDTMVFEYTMREQNAGYSDEEIKRLCDETFVDNKEQYQKVVDEMTAYVGKPCKLIVRYVNADGSIIASETFH